MLKLIIGEGIKTGERDNVIGLALPVGVHSCRCADSGWYGGGGFDRGEFGGEVSGVGVVAVVDLGVVTVV